MDPITPDQLRELVETHTFTQLEGSTTIVCLLTLKSGARVLGHSFGPLDPARFDFEKGCNIAYDKALAQLWDFEGYHRLALAAMPDEQKPITPVQTVTDDMKLPEGSAVFQIIKNVIDGQQNLDMRGVMVGTNQYDPLNPAHRLLAAISNNIDKLLEMAGGGIATPVNADEIEQRLLDSNAVDVDPDQTREVGFRPELAMGYKGNPAEENGESKGVEYDLNGVKGVSYKGNPVPVEGDDPSAMNGALDI